ncbi:hypothetical protein SAMN04489726_7510 [Allokutzneria albata]|uniref:Uncharacterized protein n=1 Tax=Allokutzneria albata TaxID=211114 RepID=A0A1H0CZS6_ALLAB|nr:hypothetical protein SAMN04489726_7510 [Allokutzneria albata]
MLAMAACGSEVGFGGQPSNKPTATSTPGQPTSDPNIAIPKPPEGGTAIPDKQLDPASQDMDGYKRLVWTKDNGATVGTYGREGGCSKVTGEAVEQTDKSIKLLLTEKVPAKPQACTMDMRYPPVEVKLAKPLGERTVSVEQRIEKK